MRLVTIVETDVRQEITPYKFSERCVIKTDWDVRLSYTAWGVEPIWDWQQLIDRVQLLEWEKLTMSYPMLASLRVKWTALKTVSIYNWVYFIK